MQKLATALVLVILASALIGWIAARSSEAGIVGTWYECADELQVARNPGNDPILWPSSATVWILIGDQTNSHAPVVLQGPEPISPNATEPTISGQVDLSTGQLQASGTAEYFFPANVFFDGTLEFDQGIPQQLSGIYTLTGTPDPPPDIDFGLACTVVEPTPAPTAPPTPSPTPGPLSITVLSVNAWSGGPISGVDVGLFANDNCSGDPIASGQSDDDGIVDFPGLYEGVFSVKQAAPAGFETAAEGECQAAATGATLPAGQVLLGNGDCPVMPNLEFPDPGCDEFDSGAQVNILLTNGQKDTVTLNGPTVIQRGAVGDDGGLDAIDTEIVLLDLTGTSTFGSVTVRESQSQQSAGQVKEKTNTAGGLEFPADSFFDVFFEIDTDVGTLHNTQPLRMECEVNQIPPILCLYQPPVPDPIELYTQQDELFGFIVHGLHIPLPLGEILVVFTNAPAPLIWGDWNCDGSVTPVDSLADLRFVAQLPPLSSSGPCPHMDDQIGGFFPWGDADCNFEVDTLDSLAILRDVAGLPVPPPVIRSGCYPLGGPAG